VFIEIIFLKSAKCYRINGKGDKLMHTCKLLIDILGAGSKILQFIN